MISPKPFFRILVLSFSFALLSNSVNAQTNAVPDAVELATLKTIYDSLGGATWTNKGGWPTAGNWPATATAAQMNTWYGITTANGDITSIALTNNNLINRIPAAIGQLTKLTYLYFGRNKIEGSIPGSIGNLTSLVHLYLSENKIEGSIPNAIGSLTKLTRIRIDQNLLTGPIPGSIGNLPFLNELNLNSNQLSGPIPTSLGSIQTLEYLYLHKNQLNDSIPGSLSALSNLKVFFVNENALSDTIPPGFSGLTSLVSFNVSKNNLVGPLPDFSQWSSIVEINLGYNGFKGAFPNSIGSCTTLTKLMAENNLFSSIPNEILTLPVNNTINFTRNLLTQIPAFENHINKTNLYLYLQYNKLDFGHFETLYNKGIKSVSYFSQNNFSDVSFIRVDPNGSLLIPARNAGVNGSITWERMIEGSSTWVNVTSQDQDATRKTFLKTPFTDSEDGKFRFKMTSTVFLGITLTSEPIVVRVGSPVVWNEQAGVTENNGILTKTTSAGWGNAKAVSENLLAANQNGSFEFVTDNNSTTSNYAIGFTTTSAGNALADLEYSIEINNNVTNKIFVHESSATGIELGTWVVGDYFKVDRQGTTIRYYKNGVLIRSSTASASKEYVVKSLLNSGHAPQVLPSFWIPASRGLVPDAWEYAVLKDLYDSLGGQSWAAKMSWPTSGNWITNFNATQLDAWFGISVESGDITELSLFQNNLVGKIPASIGNLKSLKRLFLQNNLLKNRIPSSIGDLTLLEYIYLYNNQLTGDLPASFGKLTNMQFLAFHKNNLTGNFDWIGKMPNMVQFYFYGNPNLNCAIPSSIGRLTKMTRLAGGGWIAEPGRPYVHTKTHGTIPDSIGYCIKLQQIYLDNSEFSGAVPTSINQLTDLRSISLFNNPSLSGNLDEFTNGLTKLTQLLIFNSNIGGTLPSSILNSTLLSLDVSKSKVRTIPATITNAINLTYIGLDSIQLTQIQDWHANFPKLTYLSAKNNQLTSFPSLATHVNKANLEIFVQNNKLDFADLESSFTAAGVHPFKTFVYSPQQNSLPVIPTHRIQVGMQLKIEAPSGGVHGIYLWEKLENGSWVNVNALNQGTVANHFIIANCQENEGGTYRYTVTNTWVPNLSFESGPINITVYDPVANAVDEFAFQYRYDGRNRLIKKKIPGADWVYMVYDNRDRLVMTQDGNQRDKEIPEWTFTKYDALNRPVLTGIYKDASGKDQPDMQSEINNYYSDLTGKAWHESIIAPEGTAHNYDNLSFPKVSSPNDYLTATYYDDYEFVWMMAPDPEFFYYDNQQLLASGTDKAQDLDYHSSVKDLVTCTKIKNLENNEWYWSVFFYDDNYRLVQSIAYNHKGGADKTTNVFDFVGKVLRTKTEHTVIGKEAQSITHKFEYDHAGRLLKTWHSLNDAIPVILSQKEYNELGQLVTKKLHSDDNGSSFKQHEDYRYNIRGWLSRINKADLTSDAPNEPTDYFGIEVAYNENLPSSNIPQFNGNISSIKWSTEITGKQSVYNYSYDPMNRLTGSTYKASSDGLNWNLDLNKFDISLGYDLNGNILQLKQFNGKEKPLDDLSYHYTGNRLGYVNERGDRNNGFIEGNDYYDDYAYDLSGNAIQDLNKGIFKTDYNYMNLPSKVISENGDYTKYIYDANGVKLGQEGFDKNNQLKQRSDYVGNFIYVDDELASINHSEGQIIIKSEATPEYQYNINDNVGNTRVIFTTKEDIDTYSAGFEDDNIEDESKVFKNYSRTQNDLFDHTDHADVYTHVQRLLGGENSIVGLAKTLEVTAGDSVKVDVYAKYFNPTDANTNGFVNVAASVINAFGLNAIAGVGEPGAFSSVNDFFSEGPAILNTGPYTWEDDEAPKAYVNVLVFNKNYEIVNFAYDQISVSAEQPLGDASKHPHDLLTAKVKIDQPGYVFIYISNENPEMVEVYFDDMTIAHEHSDVVQRDDFYPFGLSIAETAFQKRNTFYRGSSYANFFGLKDLGFRRYDPSTARFFSIDPLAELQLEETPYQYSKNNPVRYIDAWGLLADELEKVKEVKMKESNLTNSKIGGGKFKEFLLKIQRKVGNFFARLTGKSGTVQAGNVDKVRKPVRGTGGTKKGGADSGNESNNNSNSEQNSYMDELVKKLLAGTTQEDDNSTTKFALTPPKNSPPPPLEQDHNSSTQNDEKKNNSNGTLVEKLNDLAQKGDSPADVKTEITKQGGPVLANQLGKLNDKTPAKVAQDQNGLDGSVADAMRKWGHNPTKPDQLLILIDEIKEANTNGVTSKDVTPIAENFSDNENYPKNIHQYNGRLEINGESVEIELNFKDVRIDDAGDNMIINPEAKVARFHLPDVPSLDGKIYIVRQAFGREGVFIQYEFSDVESEEDVKFTITVPKDKASDFEKYLQIEGYLDVLLENRRLAASEVNEARQLIEEEDDVEKRKELYRTLQEKIPYTNQRKLDIESENGSLERVERGSEKLGDYMCQLTCLAQILVLFGEDENAISLENHNREDHPIPNPLTSEYSTFKSHPNYRTQHALWSETLDDFGYKMEQLTPYSNSHLNTREEIETDFKPILERGDGIILSISRSDGTDGHIVRVQAVTEEGLIVDDPFGKTSPATYYNDGARWSETNSSFKKSEENNAGEDVLWKWEDIIKMGFKIVYKISKKE